MKTRKHLNKIKRIKAKVNIFVYHNFGIDLECIHCDFKISIIKPHIYIDFRYCLFTFIGISLSKIGEHFKIVVFDKNIVSIYKANVYESLGGFHYKSNPIGSKTHMNILNKEIF